MRLRLRGLFKGLDGSSGQAPLRMEHITHVPFGTEESDGTIVVRAGEGRVQIGIFHSRHGDIDAVMSAEQAQELIDALGQALEKA